MPSCAQLHYKKDQIESCPLGWARNFFMTYLMENLVVTEKIANFALTKVPVLILVSISAL